MRETIVWNKINRKIYDFQHIKMVLKGACFYQFNFPDSIFIFMSLIFKLNLSLELSLVNFTCKSDVNLGANFKYDIKYKFKCISSANSGIEFDMKFDMNLVKKVLN